MTIISDAMRLTTVYESNRNNQRIVMNTYCLITCTTRPYLSLDLIDCNFNFNGAVIMGFMPEWCFGRNWKGWSVLESKLPVKKMGYETVFNVSIGLLENDTNGRIPPYTFRSFELGIEQQRRSYRIAHKIVRLNIVTTIGSIKLNWKWKQKKTCISLCRLCNNAHYIQSLTCLCSLCSSTMCHILVRNCEKCRVLYVCSIFVCFEK